MIDKQKAENKQIAQFGCGGCFGDPLKPVEPEVNEEDANEPRDDSKEVPAKSD